MRKKAISYISKYLKGNMENKTIIITGGNSGIGLQSAKYCLYLKMNVVLAVRSLERGQKAIDELHKEFPEGKVSLMELDVSVEQSIINFVKKIIEDKIDIDVFYHNAGVYHLPFEIKEGREISNSTNFYGPLMLTSLLLDYLHSLKHEVKMVITSSLIISFYSVDESSLLPDENTTKMERYANSKILDAYLFDYLYRNDKSNIKYYLVHPGATATGLIAKGYKNKAFIKLGYAFTKAFCNPLWKSSLSIVRVLSEDAPEGTFYGPSHIFNALGYPKVVKFHTKRLKNVDELIKKAEIAVGYKLLK